MVEPRNAAKFTWWSSSPTEDLTGHKCQQCYSLGTLGNSLVVQWLGLHAFNAEGPSMILRCRTKIPQATQSGQKKKKRKKKLSDLVGLRRKRK